MEDLVDKAGAEYWTQVWKNATLPPPINVDSKSLPNTVYHRYHQIFQKILNKIETKNKSILEVGCGNSVWLPYFAKHFGLKVSGLDYSEYGCETESAILKRDSVEGNIYHGDMFTPPDELLGKFDFVLSMGVIEHFSDTTNVVRTLAKFLKPGGMLITTLPNHTGVLGLLQKLFNKPVYDIHYIIDKSDVENAVTKAGLKLHHSQYAVSGGFMVNLEAKDKPLRFAIFRKMGAKVLVVITFAWWFINRSIFRLPENKTFSPAIINIAKKD
jgi:2-polyprenyl-3-methyl-5-hydroxy-6-metoxy-1,4-benzoquinol methylase